jgi:hypothetical protein
MSLVIVVLGLGRIELLIHSEVAVQIQELVDRAQAHVVVIRWDRSRPRTRESCYRRITVQ